MRLTRLVATLSLVLSAGAAHAAIGSPFPGNQIDDFGDVATTSTSAAGEERPTGYASIIPANQIDNFGEQAASGSGTAISVPTGYASIIPGNQIDDFTPSAPSAPGPSAVAAHGEAPAPRS